MSKNVRLNSTHYYIMEISNKRELQQIAYYESAPKMYCKTTFFFSDWCYSSIRWSVDGVQKLIMTIDDKTKDEKLQYDIKRETARILTLSSYCKYKHIASEEILPSSRSQIIKQAKFTYSPLGEALEKQT